MAKNRDDVFETITRLVKEGMYRRFRRDPIVVQTQGTKLKIEYPGETGTYLSREYTPAEIAQLSPDELASGLLDAYANEQKRVELLAYAKQQFPEANDVRLLDDVFSPEVSGVVQLTFSGVRVLAGFTRELWDHTETFVELRAHMERHRWRETVNEASSRKVLLGQDGWLDKQDW